MPSMSLTHARAARRDPWYPARDRGSLERQPDRAGPLGLYEGVNHDHSNDRTACT